MSKTASANLPPVTLRFLEELKENNNRAWFNARKDQYQAARASIIDLADQLLHGLRQMDEIETPSGKRSLYRIYRDVRFSKDKTPYNHHWSGGFSRLGATRRGSYYFRVEPGGESLAGGGFWGPNSGDMQLIRSHIDQDEQPLRNVLEDPGFKKMFGSLQGEQLKTAPRGMDKDHPSIDLLRYKQFFVFRHFSDEEVLSPGFAQKILQTYAAMRPFLDCMTEMLTTDLNGVSLVD